jgi:hypothetical protein
MRMTQEKAVLVQRSELFSSSETSLRVHHTFTRQANWEKVPMFSEISGTANLVPVVCWKIEFSDIKMITLRSTSLCDGDAPLKMLQTQTTVAVGTGTMEYCSCPHIVPLKIAFRITPSNVFMWFHLLFCCAVNVPWSPHISVYCCRCFLSPSTVYIQT